jgi:hypothetical protein
MKFLKYLGLGIAGVIAILLIVAAFLPKHFHTEASATVNKPAGEVFTYIRLLKNQDQFSYWNLQDPAMKKAYSGMDGTPGATYSWNSQNEELGQGTQTIRDIAENERLSLNMHFIKPFENESDATITTKEGRPGVTTVTWAFDDDMPWPMNLMPYAFNMKKTLGDMLQTSVNNIKKNLEGSDKS